MDKLQVICHGIPDMRPLQEGDICNVDVTVYHRWSKRSIDQSFSVNNKLYRGYHGDLNETIFVGEVSQKAKDLVVNTWECLEKAIAECVKPGVKYRDVGSVIQKHATTGGYSVVRSYCGHGIHKWALGLILHLIGCPGCSTAPRTCLTMQRTRLWEWWSLGTASPSSRWSPRGWVPCLCSSAHSLPVQGLGRPDLAWQLDLGDARRKTLRSVRADHGCHRHRGRGQMLCPVYMSFAQLTWATLSGVNSATRKAPRPLLHGLLIWAVIHHSYISPCWLQSELSTSCDRFSESRHLLLNPASQ